MDFNEKLQQLRKQRNLTQEELANELYVSRTAISKWESGRGYPSLDSLRAISKLFSVSIDDLLSGEELITAAETDNQEKVRGLRDFVFGVLDCMPILLFFLPFFGQKEHDMVRAVSLLSLNSNAGYIRTAFILTMVLTIIYGIAELALQNIHHRIWLRGKTKISLFLTLFGTMLFIASPQPYAAAFMLCLLVVKGVLLIKRQ